VEKRCWQIHITVPAQSERRPDGRVTVWVNVVASTVKAAMEAVEREYKDPIFYQVNDKGQIHLFAD
jgi:hypothetical protein